MPMVGTPMASVTAAPTTSGTPSITKAKQPAASRDLAASSRAPAASTLLAWTRKPPMARIDCGVRPRWPITGISARMMASMTGRRARPPSSLTAWAPARISLAALRTASSVERW